MRRQDHEHCASITCMIRHYVARRAQVTEGHPHSAADRVGLRCSVPDTVLSAGTMSGPDAEMRPRAGWVRAGGSGLSACERDQQRRSVPRRRKRRRGVAVRRAVPRPAPSVAASAPAAPARMATSGRSRCRSPGWRRLPLQHTPAPLHHAEPLGRPTCPPSCPVPLLALWNPSASQHHAHPVAGHCKPARPVTVFGKFPQVSD